MTTHAPPAVTLVGFDAPSSARLAHRLGALGILRAQQLQDLEQLESRGAALPQPAPRVLVLGDGIAPLPRAIAHLGTVDTVSRILVLSRETSEAAILAILRAGADGYLEASATPGQVADAVRMLARGELALSPLATRRLVENLIRPVSRASSAPEGLSCRESEVFDLLVEGLRYREIASRLFISLDTVRSHIRRIYRKLAVSSRAELTARFS